ncbi:hypothetical protein BH09VER1_BH09VER1_43390 [soil metagenome]
MIFNAEYLYAASLLASAAMNLTILSYTVPAWARPLRPGPVLLSAAATMGLFLSLAYGICGAHSIFMNGHSSIYSGLFLMDIATSVLYAIGVVSVLRELNAAPIPARA